MKHNFAITLCDMRILYQYNCELIGNFLIFLFKTSIIFKTRKHFNFIIQRCNQGKNHKFKSTGF